MSANQLDETYAAELRRPLSTPERRMWVAVLRRAIWDFAMYRDTPPNGKKFSLAADAAGWIWFDGEEFGTFRAVCMHLDLDHTGLRKQILTLKRGDVEKINKRIETEV